MISVDYLRSILRYDGETGTLWWRHRDDMRKEWNTRFAHTQAFYTSHSKGYVVGTINNRKYFAHRVAFALHYGEWPSGEVDHINGNKTDNRIQNIREATNSENMRNTGKYSTNKSGKKGVCFDKRSGRWHAQIMRDYKKIHLGYFTTPEEAHAAYCDASTKYHGEYGKTE